MGTLNLHVDRGSEVPLGTQLIWKLRTAIATGLLAPGAKLPGIREVADAAGVNINTVRSVFARLEDQGLLASEQGRGTFVAEHVRADALLADMADAAIAQARELGIDPRELAAALYVTARESGAQAQSGQRERSISPAIVTDRRGERRGLYDEIARLESDLAALEPLRPLERRPEAAAPRVLSLAELRGIRDGLVGRIEELRRERAQWRQENDEALAAQAEAQESSASGARLPRWRQAGVWTGRAPARVSWTTP